MQLGQFEYLGIIVGTFVVPLAVNNIRLKHIRRSTYASPVRNPDSPSSVCSEFRRVQDSLNLQDESNESISNAVSYRRYTANWRKKQNIESAQELLAR